MKAELTTITITIPGGEARISTLVENGSDAGTKLELSTDVARALFHELEKMFGTKSYPVYVDRPYQITAPNNPISPITVPNNPFTPSYPGYPHTTWCGSNPAMKNVTATSSVQTPGDGI